MATLTTLAKIYGHPTGKRKQVDHKILKTKTSLKSGLTPSFPLEGVRGNNTEHRKLEIYQRKRFYGFTATELQASESLAPYHAPEDERLLNDPTANQYLQRIHPVFAKSQWQDQLPKHQALFPLGNGRPGFWHVDTPRVWEALEPAIILATQFIVGGTAWSWWDTLLAGESTQIPVTEYPEDYDHETKGMRYRIRPRPSIELHQNRTDIDQIFRHLANDVMFHFSSGDIHPSTGNKRGFNTTGETLFQISDKTIVYFSFENLEPLLNDQITAAERMACHFRNATILLHELAHAIWGAGLWKTKIVPVGLPGEPCAKEPYINTEYFSELGFSMELFVFGGMTAGYEFNHPTAAQSKGFPNAGMFHTSISTCSAKDYLVLDENPILNHGMPDDWKNQTFFPIPLAYFYKVNNGDFWNYQVRAFGDKAAYLGPKTVGSRWQGDATKINSTPGEDDVPLIIYDFSAEGVFRTIQENSRRAQRTGILESLGLLNKGELPNAMVPPNILTPGDTFHVGRGLRETVTKNTVKRNQEILAYFDDNRLELAVDTMVRMTENVLYSHLIRTVGLGNMIVTPAEFRVFLKYCKRKKEIFRWIEVNMGPRPTQGVVMFIKDGWKINELLDGPNITTPRRDFVPVSAEMIEEFDESVDNMIYGCFHFNAEGQKDLDFNLFLKWMNISHYNLHSDSMFYEAWTKENLLRCIYDWEARGEKWTVGPLDLPEGNPPVRYPSVVRKLGVGWVDPASPEIEEQGGSGTTQKMKKKRKRKEAEDEVKSTGGRVEPIVCGKEPLKRKRRVAKGGG